MRFCLPPPLLLLLHVAVALEGESECASLTAGGQCKGNTTREAAAGENDVHKVETNVQDKDVEEAYYFDMGVPQRMDRVDFDDFRGVMDTAYEHLMEVSEDPELDDVFTVCKNKDPLCAEWALEKRCGSVNAKEMYMMDTTCCPVCESTNQLDYLLRCPIDPDAYTAYAKPGDVTKHFLRSLETIDPKHEPQVLSAPNYLPGDNSETADYVLGGPWIVTMENFVNETEADRLIYWGKKFGYDRSTDNGGQVVRWRTSNEVFCEEPCNSDPIIQNIMRRVVDIVGIPDEHSDYLQLLQYGEGGFYKVHQDYHQHQVFSATGARITTFYMYLNTVEDGGGTNFPALNLTIMPKFGRVAMWSNVLDSDPEEEDVKARHQALPVLRGEKYGATAWFHHRDFKNNNPEECGG